MWWRWLQHPHEVWAQLWKQKYAPIVQHDQLIRFNEQRQGSNIWNTAWRNRSLIQQHAFWEIQNGESALFWQDSWQQLPPLDEMESLHPLRIKLRHHGLKKVKYFWLPNHGRQQWRPWKTSKVDLQIVEDNVCSSRRFLLRTAGIFFGGVTLPHGFSQSKRPTTSLRALRIKPLKEYGVKSGSLSSGPRYPSFFG